jgi:type I restriction enzyme S subunit
VTAIRLKHVARIIAGQSPESADVTDQPEGLPFLQGSAEFGKKHPVSKSFCAVPPKVAPAGSWLMSVRAPVGTLNLADKIYCIGRGLAAIEPRDVDSSFLGYALEDAKPFLSAISTGSTFQAISTHQLENVELGVPPPEAQRRIARFLDEKTAQIDGLIDKKRALLDRLAEKRQALITRAVTKGLNPAAPMKPSGIDWLGDIPTHWEVASLGYRYEVQLGRMLNAERSTGEHLRPYLRVLDVQWGSISTDQLPTMDFPPEAQARYLLRDGDLLVNEGGSYVGRSAIWRGQLDECYYQKALHRLRAVCSDRDTAEYLYFLMEAATKNDVFSGGGNQTTIDHLTAEQFRAYRFPFPPPAEQLEIARTLQKASSDENSIADAVERSISGLAEYRSALITAAVTGKLDVR